MSIFFLEIISSRNCTSTTKRNPTASSCWHPTSYHSPIFANPWIEIIANSWWMTCGDFPISLTRTIPARTCVHSLWMWVWTNLSCLFFWFNGFFFAQFLQTKLELKNFVMHNSTIPESMELGTYKAQGYIFKDSVLVTGINFVISLY